MSSLIGMIVVETSFEEYDTLVKCVQKTQFIFSDTWFAVKFQFET